MGTLRFPHFPQGDAGYPHFGVPVKSFPSAPGADCFVRDDGPSPPYGRKWGSWAVGCRPPEKIVATAKIMMQCPCTKTGDWPAEVKEPEEPTPAPGTPMTPKQKAMQLAKQKLKEKLAEQPGMAEKMQRAQQMMSDSKMAKARQLYKDYKETDDGLQLWYKQLKRKWDSMQGQKDGAAPGGDPMAAKQFGALGEALSNMSMHDQQVPGSPVSPPPLPAGPALQCPCKVVSGQQPKAESVVSSAIPTQVALPLFCGPFVAAPSWWSPNTHRHRKHSISSLASFL
eukprot:gnl/TRDRNA2_/TRDRNA2_133603_c0_seq1.p1 gnl/TRDRNA2_/TRDRNA2_133603_c0~~gnl/TRDRNA2_/TRDRNA2_133603_c0_seq1.p1  ORF type:complete len:283 (+),score=46.01 gnl/TRDRNA2_/TRDRNA2_133603_c0_seq1:82-930(+)